MIWAAEDVGSEILYTKNQTMEMEPHHAQSIFQKTYKGNWIMGEMQGIGKYTLSEGEFYYGYFKNNIPNGHGIRKFANGDLYDGQYVDGYQSG